MTVIDHPNTAELRHAIEARMIHLGFQAVDVARRSGGKVSQQVVYSILASTNRRVRLTTLEGISAAIDIPLVDLLAATEVGSRWVMPEHFNDVPPRVRRIVEAFLDAKFEAAGYGTETWFEILTGMGSHDHLERAGDR